MSRIKKCNHSIFDQHCASCKKLKTQWYKKLEQDAKANPDEGFEDIELDEDRLQFNSTEFYSKDYDKSVRDSKQEYYILATHFLEEYKFDSKREQIIWEYHSNGISMRNISKLLKKVRIKMHRNEVNAIIIRLKFKMFDMYVNREPKHV